MIEIADNGPGIPDTLRAHLFDPFVSSKRVGNAGTVVGNFDHQRQRNPRIGALSRSILLW